MCPELGTIFNVNIPWQTASSLIALLILTFGTMCSDSLRVLCCCCCCCCTGQQPMGVRGGKYLFGELSTSKWSDWAARRRHTRIFFFTPNPRLLIWHRNRKGLADTEPFAFLVVGVCTRQSLTRFKPASESQQPEEVLVFCLLSISNVWNTQRISTDRANLLGWSPSRGLW